MLVPDADDLADFLGEMYPGWGPIRVLYAYMEESEIIVTAHWSVPNWEDEHRLPIEAWKSWMTGRTPRNYTKIGQI